MTLFSAAVSIKQGSSPKTEWYLRHEPLMASTSRITPAFENYLGRSVADSSWRAALLSPSLLATKSSTSSSPIGYEDGSPLPFLKENKREKKSLFLSENGT